MISAPAECRSRSWAARPPIWSVKAENRYMASFTGADDPAKAEEFAASPSLPHRRRHAPVLRSDPAFVPSKFSGGHVESAYPVAGVTLISITVSRIPLVLPHMQLALACSLGRIARRRYNFG
jgi:hypothetical protein